MIKKLVREIYFAFLNFTYFVRIHFGMKAFGLGMVASLIKFEFHFHFHGSQFLFFPSAARSYGFLPIGIPNEPETHKFFERIMVGRSDVLFIDVGASIGEFAITMANDTRVSKVLAFEPHPQSRDALAKSPQYAPPGKIEIISKGVSLKKRAC